MNRAWRTASEAAAAAGPTQAGPGSNPPLPRICSHRCAHSRCSPSLTLRPLRPLRSEEVAAQARVAVLACAWPPAEVAQAHRGGPQSPAPQQRASRTARVSRRHGLRQCRPRCRGRGSEVHNDKQGVILQLLLVGGHHHHRGFARKPPEEADALEEVKAARCLDSLNQPLVYCIPICYGPKKAPEERASGGQSRAPKTPPPHRALPVTLWWAVASVVVTCATLRPCPIRRLVGLLALVLVHMVILTSLLVRGGLHLLQLRIEP